MLKLTMLREMMKMISIGRRVKLLMLSMTSGNLSWTVIWVSRHAQAQKRKKRTTEHDQ